MINKIRKAIKRRQIAKKNLHVHKLSTLDLIKQYIQSKLPRPKESAINPNASMMPNSSAGKINHIAIVLDGRVEEILRAQNRLTALLLSEPQFIEFDPQEVYPQVGFSEYRDGKFINAETQQEPEGLL